MTNVQPALPEQPESQLLLVLYKPKRTAQKTQVVSKYISSPDSHQAGQEVHTFPAFLCHNAMYISESGEYIIRWTLESNIRQNI